MALTLRIASPCSEKWESMTGDERTRFCAKCQWVFCLSSLFLTLEPNPVISLLTTLTFGSVIKYS